MKKEDIDSILLANWYLTKCRIENPNSDRAELARKYLTKSVKNALSNKSNLYKTKAFLFLSILTF